MRRKEHALKPLYTRRQALLSQVPDFWPTVFGNGPQELQQFLTPEDLPLVSAITSFSVERYQIESETKGEPRSLRFTFEFDDNNIIEDKKLVKEFEYRSREDGPGSLISKPVAIKFKNKKNDLTQGALDAAVELYRAEEALKLKSGEEKEIEIVDREALWQHEKLREKLVKLDEEESQPSFFNWFGFRGAVNATKKAHGEGENGVDDEEDEEEDVDQLLEVEIFPAGEELAITLAEELWSDAMDYFSGSSPCCADGDHHHHHHTDGHAVSAQDEASFDGEGFNGFDGEGSSDDEEAPELVEAVEPEDRPRKKQRKA